MVSMSYFSGNKIEDRDSLEAIETKKPIQKLGYVEDTKGTIWHIGAIVEGIVYACTVPNLNDYYTSTVPFDDCYTVSQTWDAYKNVVI